MGAVFDLKKIFLWLVVAFVFVSIWTDPSGSATTAGRYLANVGHFLIAVMERLAQFVRGLTTGKST